MSRVPIDFLEECNDEPSAPEFPLALLEPPESWDRVEYFDANDFLAIVEDRAYQLNLDDEAIEPEASFRKFHLHCNVGQYGIYVHECGELLAPPFVAIAVTPAPEPYIDYGPDYGPPDGADDDQGDDPVDDTVRAFARLPDVFGVGPTADAAAADAIGRMRPLKTTRSFLDLPVLKYSPAWALISEDERAFVRVEDHPDGPQSLEELSPYLECATEVTEFSVQAQALGLDNVFVGRGQAWIGNESGFCYSADQYPELRPNSILMINPDNMPAHMSLVDVFLHEAAHIFTNGDEHAWTFLVVLNVMRLRCGLGPSADSYDWSGMQFLPELRGFSFSESSIQSSGADIGRLLSPLPYEVDQLRFLIQGIWDEVASKFVNTPTNVDFEELCRTIGQRAVSKWMNSVQSAETS